MANQPRQQSRHQTDQELVPQTQVSSTSAHSSPPIPFWSKLSPTSLSVLVLGLLTFLHSTALYIFSQGFLLSRVTLVDRSVCDPSSQLTSPAIAPSCMVEPSHSKAIIILIDALRYDFILPHSSNYSIDPFNHNQLPLPSQLTLTRPNHSRLFHFLADPPTTTLQRLKGLTTGTLPTFIDIGSNFATTNVGIDEDSWLAQLKSAKKKIGFAGDDTWLKLFGTPSQSPQSHLASLFDPNITFGYESFNVEDLDTVDDGVQAKLFQVLGIDHDQAHRSSQPDWDVLIGHFLGLDHAGHRFGASHPTVRAKLHQYNRFLEKIVANLDDDTLLVVMGDHGMDSKGDHGGDSFSEVSTALWVYSKSRPLLNEQDPLPSWALDESSFLNLEPSLGKTRTVAQIDLVPTLSLMLGIPIPFSNLGLIIPEFFFRSTLPPGSSASRARKPELLSSTETLLLSVAINSDQLWNFVERYAGSPNSPGHDLSAHVPELKILYNKAAELYRQKSYAEAFQANRSFGASLLSTSRRIWAKFVPSLMLIGIIIMAVSLLVSWKLLRCIRWTTVGPHAPARLALRAGFSMGALGLVLGVLVHLSRAIADLNLHSSLLAGSSLGACLGVLGHRSQSLDQDVSLKIPSPNTLAKLFPVILHALALGSNSYTVWEDQVILYLISISVFLPVLIVSFSAPQKRLRNRLLLFSLLFGTCARLISFSTVCREEQHGECSVTFYANSTTSNAPNWAMSILIPLALALPLVPAWFLGFSDSYRGPASFYFGSAWRFILLCGAQYWITDYIISHEDLSLTSSLVNTGVWIKMVVARVDIILCLFSGGLLWFVLPLCIDVKRDEPEKEPGPMDGKKPRLLVIGFANAYGSSYLMFFLACFGILFLVTPPVGQVVLSIGLVAMLSLVEINDSLEDVGRLQGSFHKAVETAAKGYQAQTHDGTSRVTSETNLGVLVGLNFLGYLIFFGTGHQATFASIQWKTGFIGLDSAHQLFSAILIGLNTFSGFILTGLSIPLFKLWNMSPIINLSKKTPTNEDEKEEGSPSTDAPMMINKLDSSMMEIELKYMNLQVFIGLVDMIFIFVLRRHLMVWKIFSPRFLMSCTLIILVDLLFLSFVLLVLSFVKLKVSRSFGNQLSI